ncbi:putative quinol monooxygenase [Mycolicibacterium sp.]|uniref:putative quinol monooxygenase n=1 Tax=Mycolicibacterium sp. TaxID=2320850 RepID=UPI0037CC3A19
MSGRFGLVVRFVLKPGHEDLFDHSARELISAVREHEPGALLFACHSVEGRSGDRIFYELYRDRDAFDAHGNHEHTQRFLAERDRHVADIRVDFLELIDAAGVVAADGGPAADQRPPD